MYRFLETVKNASTDYGCLGRDPFTCPSPWGVGLWGQIRLGTPKICFNQVYHILGGSKYVEYRLFGDIESLKWEVIYATDNLVTFEN